MSKFNTVYEKHKSKILVALSLLVVAGVSYGVYNIANNQHVDRIEETLPVDKNYVLADYIIAGNDVGLVRLIGVKEGAEINSIDLRSGRDSKYGYSRSNDLTKLYAYGSLENVFYEISQENKKLTLKSFVDLKDKKLKFSDFKIEEDNVVTLTSDRKSFNRISKIDKSIVPIALTDAVEQWTLLKNQIIYTSGDKIVSIDLKNNSKKQIDIGDTNTGLFCTNGEILAFNKFGSGKNTSIVLKINPSDLYVKNMFKFESSNVMGLPSDSDDSSIYFVDELKDNGEVSQILSNINLDKFTKDKVSINSQKKPQDFKYNAINSIGSKGYIYSLVDNKLEILDMRSQMVSYKIELGNSVFLPVLK